METSTTHTEALEQQPTSSEFATDEQGYVREILTLDEGVRVTFRSRDEHFPTFEDAPSRCLTLDELPHHAINFEPSNAPESQLLIANATPKGIIDLAIELNPQNEKLSPLRQNFETHTLGDAENALLDLMIAGLYESRASQAYNEPPSVSGLLDVARALNGDKAATERLHTQLAVLEREERLATLRELGEEALDKCLHFETSVSPELAQAAEGIVLVRATSFEPYINEHGDVQLRSASDETRQTQRQETDGAPFYVPRNTLHFSLNHEVISHFFGNFEGRKYTIIAPLKQTLLANGLPTQINGVDTYFTIGPTELLTIPGAHIAEADPLQTEIVTHHHNRSVFKSEGFTAEHAPQILAACQNGEFSGTPGNPAEYLLSRTLIDQAEAIGLFNGITSGREYFQEEVDKGQFDAWRMTEPLDKSYAQSLDFVELVEYLASRGTSENQPVSYDVILAGLVRSLTINGIIEQQGGEVVSGGEQTTGSVAFEEKLSHLREVFEVSGGGHMGTSEELTESIAVKYLSNNHAGGPPDGLNTQLRKPDLPHAMKRAYMYEGLLSTSSRFKSTHSNEGI
jgi:hypothetical protein